MPPLHPVAGLSACHGNSKALHQWRAASSTTRHKLARTQQLHHAVKFACRCEIDHRLTLSAMVQWPAIPRVVCSIALLPSHRSQLLPVEAAVSPWLRRPQLLGCQRHLQGAGLQLFSQAVCAQTAVGAPYLQRILWDQSLRLYRCECRCLCELHLWSLRNWRATVGGGATEIALWPIITWAGTPEERHAVAKQMG